MPNKQAFVKMTKMNHHGDYWFVTLDDGERSRTEAFGDKSPTGLALNRRHQAMLPLPSRRR